VTRALPIIVALMLAVYALIDCLQADPADIRGLRRPVWVALIVLVPFIGPAAWLISRGGMPRGPKRPRKRPSAPPPVAPDDNPEFLNQLREIDEEHEEMLTQWEADLRRREEEMRDKRDDGDDGRSA
jgi:hypothetical protein